MAEITAPLKRSSITLVCFGEYVGFVHFGNLGFLRFETEVVLVGKEGKRDKLFPKPSEGVVGLILGRKIKNLVVNDVFTVVLDNDLVIEASRLMGYESVTASVDGQIEIY